jgi:hypothetical protein
MISPRRLLHSLIAASLAVVAACGDPVGPGRSDLRINREKWLQHGYRDYSVTMGKFCFCADIGPFDVRVLGDSVVAAVRTSDGAPTLEIKYLPTVNKLFDFIQKAIDDNTKTISVTYDAELGFPREVVYDLAGQAYDAGVTYTLRDLKPLPSAQRIP